MLIKIVFCLNKVPEQSSGYLNKVQVTGYRLQVTG